MIKLEILRYLKDERFIEWMLKPTDELDSYWEVFAAAHPEEVAHIEQAKAYFKRIKLGHYQTTAQQRTETLNALHKSLNAHRRKKQIRRIAYGVVACAIIVVLSLTYFYGYMHSSSELTETADYIVGSELESESILLITGGTSTVFDSDVAIAINQDQSVSVSSGDNETRTIAIEEHTTNKLIVPYGKRSQLKLADGTRVWLNSGSSLVFPSSFDGDKREVSLNGEMYIEVVQHDKIPFFVKTPHYNVRVYGTAFNVSTYGDSPSSVVLVEGSVALQSQHRDEMFLTPNEQAIFSPSTGGFEKRKVDPALLTSWKDGYLTFEDTPITEALKQIGRYYNISFDVGDNATFQGLTCTGKIILSDDVYNVITALALISGMDYRVEEDRIYIFNADNEPM